MSKPLRVLIVEDDEDDMLLLLRQLQKGGYEPEYERVDNAGAMREALSGGGWDLVISDYKMPSFDGFASLRIFQEMGGDIPFILVSGAVGEKIAVEVMKAGAHDFIMKDQLSRLVPAMEREFADAEIRRNKRLAEEETLRARREWELIFQAISHPTFLLDANFGIIKANVAAAAIAGVTADEMTGGKCYEILHGVDTVAPPSGCPMRQLLASGDRQTVETEMQALGKRYIVSCTPVFDDQGVLSRVIHIATDITARHQAEESLRESEKRYRDIFENAQESIYRVTPEGQIILANPAMASMFGYSSPEEMTASVKDMAKQHYVDPSDRDSLRKIVEEKGEVSGYETQLYRRDGNLFWASVTIHAVSDEQGRVLYYEGVMENITERKHNQDRMRKALGATVQAISVAVEMKDPYTAGHQRRTADLARAIAREMDLPAERVDFIFMAATIHDIGKIGLPAEILSKPARLTPVEFALIQLHAQLGYDILKGIEFPWPVADLILQHHERLDGSGYPKGLRGEEMLLEARIMVVADVVEAIASHRPYRPALGLDVALGEINKGRDIIYDAAVVDACLRLFREKGYAVLA